MTPSPLSRYERILDGVEESRYLAAKDLFVDVDLSSDTAELWRAHASATGSDPGNDDVSLLDLKVEIADRMLESCRLCERRCMADRRRGQKGHCEVLEPRIASEFLHYGEEPELVPSYTVFFSGCTFDCVYCQNWDISTRPGSGVRADPGAMARMIERHAMKDDASGDPSWSGTARNVNWVGGDPTSNLPFVLETLNACRANLPQIWNSNMYLTEESMALLGGVVDVFLTDFKYGNDGCAKRLSNVDDYMEVVTRNHLIARSSSEMIVRHLVLPSHLECCTRPVLEWISDNLDGVKVNLMDQYRPAFRAREFEEISMPLTAREFASAERYADELGLDTYG